MAGKSRDFGTVLIGRTSVKELEYALMTIQEVADYFGRNHESVRRWIRSGTLRHIRKDKVSLIPRAWAEEFVPPPRGNPVLLKEKPASKSRSVKKAKNAR